MAETNEPLLPIEAPIETPSSVFTNNSTQHITATEEFVTKAPTNSPKLANESIQSQSIVDALKIMNPSKSLAPKRPRKPRAVVASSSEAIARRKEALPNYEEKQRIIAAKREQRQILAACKKKSRRDSFVTSTSSESEASPHKKRKKQGKKRVFVSSEDESSN